MTTARSMSRSMSGSSSRVRVVETSTSLVAPADPALPPRSVALTFFDVKWLHLPPVERVFVYRLSPDADVAAIVAGLKASLAQALRAFYPLAGRVRLIRSGSSSIRHELCYRPGDAVPFTIAAAAVEDGELINNIVAGSSSCLRVAALAPLVPQLPNKERGVLAVQVTTISSSSSRGPLLLAVGVTVHHSACDGAGSTHFLHTWAWWACSNPNSNGPPPEPPAMDRAALVPDPRGLYDIYLKSLPPTITDDDALEFVCKPPESYQDKLLATFTLPRSLLDTIKAAVAGEAARRGIEPPPRCSTMLAAYAFMWACYCRAMPSSSSSTTTSRYFLFSVDQRSRLMHPPVPATYLGNCLCPAIAAAPEEELAAPGTTGLLAASTAVAAALEEQVRQGAQDTWDTCVDRVKQGAARGMLSVAGSPRFRVYDVDLGLGRPAKVLMVSAAKGGAMPVAEARDGAGVEVGVSLPPGPMERFQKAFADGIACLSSAASSTS